MALSSGHRISALHQGAQATRNSIRPCQSGALLGRLAARASRIANPRPRIDDKRSHDPRGAFFRLSNAAGSSNLRLPCHPAALEHGRRGRGASA